MSHSRTHLEKLALVVAVARSRPGGAPPARPTFTDRRVARAVLEAMRDPSEAMLWAYELPDVGPDEIRALWQAMIDTALKESSDEG